MTEHRSYRELLYQYEILRSRLDIREHYLRTVVKEVYDNVGQVLSLIRVQLTLLRSDFESGKKEKIDSSGELVGKTIRDLRNMCQLFYPEAEITGGAGFNRAIEYEMKDWFPEAVCIIDKNSGLPEKINEDKGLVLFDILLEIFSLIKQKCNGKLYSMTIKHGENKITITINYSGDEIVRSEAANTQNSFEMSIFERAELLDGNLVIKNIEHADRRIKLVIPIS
jgi:nitrate/nitrite-specific signal transduction histidine kinase